MLGGNRWVREAAAAPLHGIMLFAFVVSPWLHRDAAESWGPGNPLRLWRAVREGPAWRRAGLVAVESQAGFAGGSSMGTGLVFQISSQYSRMERSEEK